MNENREYCHNCGVQITEPSAFCSSCGTALTRQGAATGASAVRSPKAPANTTASAEASAAMSTHAAATATADPRRDTSGTAGASTPTQPAAGAPGPVAPDAGAPGAGSPPAGISAGDEGQPKPSRRWLPFALVGGGAFVVIAAVVALLLALGGSAGKDVKSAEATRQQALSLLAANGTTTVSRAAPGLYALVNAGKLSVAVPAGWRATTQAAGPATRAEFADPVHSGSSLTVVAEKVGGGNAHTRATAARKAASKNGGVSSLASVTFPGGRQAWRLTYSAASLTHNTYFFAACNGAVAIVVDAAAHAATMQQQQTSLEAAAASVEPRC